jgi:O-antigen/teichoic acid export membrane protein
LSGREPTADSQEVSALVDEIAEGDLGVVPVSAGLEAAGDVPIAPGAPLVPRLVRWGMIVGEFGAVQVGVQLAGLVAGFLIIRALSKEQYAVYILAATGLGILSVLSDSGISAATMSLIGPNRHDDGVVTRYYLAARKLRWLLFAVAGIALLPFLLRLADTEGTGYLWAAVYCSIVLVAGFLQLNYTLSTIIPKVHQDLRPIQRIELTANLVRLAAVVGIVLVLPRPMLFLATSVLSALWMAVLGERLSGRYLDRMADDVRPEIRNIWNRTLPQIPNSVFYCFFGQASLIVIAMLGQDAQVAEVGALGRLSVLFAVATSTIGAVIVPRFSRITDATLLRARYWQVIAVQIGLSCVLFLIAATLPSALLLILGNSYVGLESVVKWSVMSALLHSLAGTVWQLNASKGWVQRAWLTIPLIVVTQLFLGTWVDLSSVRGAILFGALPMVPALVFLVALGNFNIRREFTSEVPAG